MAGVSLGLLIAVGGGVLAARSILSQESVGNVTEITAEEPSGLVATTLQESLVATTTTLVKRSTTLEDTADIDPIREPEAESSLECSQPSRQPTEVTFVNQTNRPVEVLWLDFECAEVPYQSLRPGESYVQGSYVGHTWVVRDQQSGEILVVTGPIDEETGSIEIVE